MDREKVIAALEDIQKSLDEGYGVGLTWKSNLIRNTLELLKKNEAVKPLSEHHLFICPMCKNCLYREQKYCDECGQAVKWE